ncbi:DUF2512 family protein [Paenibacillus sp. TAF58]
MLGKLLLKLLLNSLVVVPLLLWFTDASASGAIVASIVLCIVAYFIGDRFILRQTNNMAATLADAVLAFIFLWIVADLQEWSLSIAELISIVLLLGFVEFVFHVFLVGDGHKETF